MFSVPKLHYFAVNEHTKYRAIQCGLDDDDRYQVKKTHNDYRFIHWNCPPVRRTGYKAYKQQLFVLPCHMMLGFPYFSHYSQ